MLINSIYFGAKNAIRNFLKDEKGDVNVVSIVVLIGVAVLLALIFKDAIAGLIDSLIDTITKNAEGAVTDPAGGGAGDGAGGGN